MDYFIKWIDIWVLTTIIIYDVSRFIWEDNICQFDLPHIIISDNGKQLYCEDITTRCSAFGIKHNFSVPYYPQGNEKVKATNNILKKRL